MYKYDLKNNELSTPIDIHKKEIFSFTVTLDHTMLITCSRDGTAKLLNPKTYEVFSVFDFDGKPCRNAAISPLYLD